jgi:hypothetical protein
MSSKMMVLDMLSLMIVDITLRMDSSKPIPLTPLLLFGIRTKVEKHVDFGSSMDLKQCLTRCVKFVQGAGLVDFSFSHCFISSTWTPEGPGARPDLSLHAAFTISSSV